MTSTTSSTTHDLPATLANMSAASLYVGDLLPHVNEVLLYKKFAPMGTVTSVKLCRDWVTGQSLCYAYVNFENPAEAEKAYRTLNYELLEGHPMRIMKSTRNPWLPKSGNCSCYHHHHCCGVSNNNNRELLDAKSLMEVIENYSMAFKNLAILDSGENKEPTGYKYSREFLKRMNTINDRFTNVFIKNFKDLLDDYKLYRLCKQFGEVTSARVMLDEYGLSKGFGFACFMDPDAAQRAVNKLNGLMLDGRTLYAGPAMTRTQRQRDYSYGRYSNEEPRNDRRSLNAVSTTFIHSNAPCSPRICIRNLRDLVDDIRLRKEFERFGPVTYAEILKMYDGRSKGVGYVLYKDQADATKALNSMHGKVIYGTRISVTYAPYTSPPTSQSDSNQFIKNCDITNSQLRNTSMVTNVSTNTGDKDGANNASNDGDNNYSKNKSIQQFKDLVTSLANKGHPVNINDINSFNNKGGTSVNRNSSNNTDNINTSNNAILAMSGRKTVEKNPQGPEQQQKSQKQEASEEKDTGDATNSNKSNEATNSRNGREGNSKPENNVGDDKGCTGSSEGDFDDNSDETMSTTATLSVKNLDESITDEKLESLFSVYGQVMSAKVVSSEHGVSKGFGFVIMSDATDAVRAIKNLDGRIVVNRPVYVALTAGQPRAVTK